MLYSYHIYIIYIINLLHFYNFYKKCLAKYINSNISKTEQNLNIEIYKISTNFYKGDARYHKII